MAQRAIEVRARLDDAGQAMAGVVALGATDARDQRQRDVFFRVPDGYLRLREVESGGATLVTQSSSEGPSPRAVEHEVARVGEPREVEALLRGRFGVRGEISYRRRSAHWRHSAIRVDEVDGLGAFLEVETAVGALDEREAQAEARMVLAALDVADGALIDGQYVDLLADADADADAARRAGAEGAGGAGDAPPPPD